ncbi:MAG: Dna2/Cas4 domain-containing protein [Bdellovibrionales bacterium]|nr:Dna2/Cas4 domain-containing protein [Bdellovibrionales bacterium]
MNYDYLRHHFLDLLVDIVNTDTNVVLLCIILVASIIVLDALSTYAKEKRIAAGVNRSIKERKQILPDLKPLSSRNYVSDMQGLAGNPDGLVSENGFIIPIEVKPLAKKIRDRYVAQLLVYMRLVEEFEGKKPPYGYLILGKKARKVKIYNSEKRQAWLQYYLDQMRDFVDKNEPLKPLPSKSKCQRCNVRHRCNFQMTESASLSPTHRSLKIAQSNEFSDPSDTTH